MAHGGSLDFDTTASVDWDTERLHQGGGLIIFDGGSYSNGPMTLGGAPLDDLGYENDESGGWVPEAVAEWTAAREETEDNEDNEDNEDEAFTTEDEEGEEEEEIWLVDGIEDETAGPSPWSTAEVEACLCWGGEQRVRVRLTVEAAGGGEGGGEVEVAPLRLTVAREAWEGLPGSFTSADQPEIARTEQRVSAGSRLTPGAVDGFWNIFETTGTLSELISLKE
jgi:hypothetical protein